MTITEAKRKIKSRLKELNYGNVSESLYINKFGDVKNLNSSKLEILDDTLTSIMDGTDPNVIAKRYNYNYNQLGNIIIDYIRMLNKEHEIKDKMLLNCIKESSINDVDTSKFLLDYLHTLQDREVDRYYLFSPPQVYDKNKTYHYSNSLYDLFTNTSDLEIDIKNDPEEVLNKVKQVYNKLDADDKKLVPELKIMDELRKVLPSNKVKLKSKVKEKH